MTDESLLQETNKEILRHLYKSLHAFVNLHVSQFCPQGEPFYIQKLFLYRAHEKLLPCSSQFIFTW